MAFTECIRDLNEFQELLPCGRVIDITEARHLLVGSYCMGKYTVEYPSLCKSSKIPEFHLNNLGEEFNGFIALDLSGCDLTLKIREACRVTKTGGVGLISTNTPLSEPIDPLLVYGNPRFHVLKSRHSIDDIFYKESYLVRVSRNF